MAPGTNRRAALKHHHAGRVGAENLLHGLEDGRQNLHHVGVVAHGQVARRAVGVNIEQGEIEVPLSVVERLVFDQVAHPFRRTDAFKRKLKPIAYTPYESDLDEVR